MILTFVDDAFALNGKTELRNELSEIEYIGIYDFSYKNRIRILDKNNNELAYIQFKVLSSVKQIGFYDKQDKLLSYIKLVDKLSDVVVEDDGLKFSGEKDNYKLVDKDGGLIMSVANNQANIENEDYLLKCIMCLFVYANDSELMNR